MEKPAKSKGRMLSFIFLSQPFSPGRGKPKNGKGFSGPIISIIPAEARRTTRSGRGSFDAQEPTSPKVSCIGQIKHRKRCGKGAKEGKAVAPEKGKKASQKPLSGIGRIFRGRKTSRRSDAEMGVEEPTAAPSLGQLRKFSSGREAFADFDWRRPGGAAALSRQRGYYSDEERAESEEEEEEEEFFVPFSGPLVAHSAPLGCAAGTEAKKEINIWKRRTVPPLQPLEIKAANKNIR